MVTDSSGISQPTGSKPCALTEERRTVCFARPIEVTRHAGRRLARSEGFVQRPLSGNPRAPLSLTGEGGARGW